MINKLILLPILLATNIVNANELAVKTSDERKTSSFYIGGLIGNSTSEESYENGITVEDDEFALGVYGGYDFSQSLGVEFSAIFTFVDNDKTELLYVDDAYLTVMSIAPKYTFNINDEVALFVKAGLGLVIYIEDYDSDDYWEYDDSDTWVGAGLSIGAGLEIMVSEHIDFRLSVDYIEAELDADEDNHRYRRSDFDIEFSTVSMGMNYRF